MTEGQKFLTALIVPNFVAFVSIIARPDLISMAIYVVGWNVLILPHLNQFLKRK